jgi:hypothetical protein
MIGNTFMKRINRRAPNAKRARIILYSTQVGEYVPVEYGMRVPWVWDGTTMRQRFPIAAKFTRMPLNTAALMILPRNRGIRVNVKMSTKKISNVVRISLA